MVFPDISYGFYEVFADLYHIDALRPKMGEGLTIDPRDYTGTGRCVVIANPNAQTGVALPLAAVEGIVKGSPESVVVVDEAYVDFGRRDGGAPRGEVPERPRRAHLFKVRPRSRARAWATPWVPRRS